jgi:glutamate 5-kinase
VPVKGEIWLDAGAERAVGERNKSLFSAGIVKVGWKKTMPALVI